MVDNLLKNPKARTKKRPVKDICPRIQKQGKQDQKNFLHYITMVNINKLTFLVWNIFQFCGKFFYHFHLDNAFETHSRKTHYLCINCIHNLHVLLTYSRHIFHLKIANTTSFWKGEWIQLDIWTRLRNYLMWSRSRAT